MVVIEENKFREIFPIHRRRKFKGYRVISILLISPPKVIYTELFCVKDTPNFFPNLFQNHPVYICNCIYTLCIIKDINVGFVTKAVKSTIEN
jgi:hypothetical protein